MAKGTSAMVMTRQISDPHANEEVKPMNVVWGCTEQRSFARHAMKKPLPKPNKAMPARYAASHARPDWKTLVAISAMLKAVRMHEASENRA